MNANGYQPHRIGRAGECAPMRDPDQTFDPRTFPQPPGPWYDYTFRRWVFPELDEARYGRPRDRFTSRLEDREGRR